LSQNLLIKLLCKEIENFDAVIATEVTMARYFEYYFKDKPYN
jgi:hypothetical protein